MSGTNEKPEGRSIPSPEPTLLRQVTLALERVRALRAALEHARSRHASLDVLLQAIERDSEIGGGLLAGALAYRLFLFFLPLTFVLIAALGLVADVFGTQPRDVARGIGIVSIVSKEVAATAKSTSGVWVGLTALVVLVYVTRVLYRTVAIVHALAWERSAAGAKSGPRSLRVFALGIAAQLVVTAVVDWAKAHGPAGAAVALVGYVLAVAGIWLAMTLRLPHAGSGWTGLIPGAVLYGVGILALHLFNLYLLGLLVTSRSNTYGTLGVAAGIMLGLYFFGRLIVGTAVLNATLFDRRSRAPSAASPEAGGRG